MNLKNLTTEELISTYSDIILLLKERGVIRTKNLIGDLAEYLVINHYNTTPGLPNLQAAPAGTQNVDALSRQGERYSIKATTGNLTGVFYGLLPPNSTEQNIQKFEFVIIVGFNENYKLKRILELSWSKFLELKNWHKTMTTWNLSITKKLIENSRIVYEDSQVKAYTLDEVRLTTPNAYLPWTVEDDEKLKQLNSEKKSIEELASIFNRKSGAITSRLMKLGFKNP